MLGLLIFALCSSLVLSAIPTTPQLSETFTSNVKLTVRDKTGSHVGSGVWAVDQPSGRGVENYEFEQKAYNFFFLDRYDQGKTYEITSANTSKCLSFGVSGSMPPVWSWLSLATFIMRTGSGNESVDVWGAEIGYATLRLGVRSSDTSIPVYLLRQARDEKDSYYEFTSWTTTTPVDKLFDVPPYCSSTDEAVSQDEACIARATTIARAKVWVANKVPYNQGADYEGYREDCSGYVSMAWESSKPGHTTSTLHEIANPISKDDLAEGDCLLYAGEHVVLFGGWTNSAKTEYQAYEETKPGEGTVTRPTPYPYWYSQSSFKPYRYTNIC